jgi:hypothetical protein
MSWKSYVLLGGLGLAMALFVASFQTFPGYMDADYYFAGGIQLVEGRGFNEPYIWNYLDEPAGLPHPSHSYWMPLASLLSAFGMYLTGSTEYASGRLVFVVLAAIVPVVTARLALTFSGRAFPALVSGLLAVFSIYYVPFLPATDNYGIYLVLGALFMLAVGWNRKPGNLAMGMIAGTMTLARSDGVLWLILGAAASLAQARLPPASHNPSSKGIRTGAQFPDATLLRLGLVLAGFALVASPWLVRNLEVYGTARAPGADRLLWLTTYDEIFAYPPESLTPQTWWNQGMEAVISARVAALRWNSLNTLAAQGGVFLLPFILLGAWEYRRDLRVRLGVGGWLGLLVVMTLAFPAVGSRGGWFHAGSGFQALWWSLAPLGLENLVAAARRRHLFTPQAPVIFGAAMVCIAAIMTAIILRLRVFPGWGEGEDRYANVDARLVTAGARPEDVVMVRNPPGYYLMTGRWAIVVPYADASGMLLAAEKYGADFLVIEEAGAAGPIRAVYDDLRSESFEFLGEEDGIRLFRIRP